MRTALPILLLAGLALFLSACGDDQSIPPTPAPAADARTVHATPPPPGSVATASDLQCLDDMAMGGIAITVGLRLVLDENAPGPEGMPAVLPVIAEVTPGLPAAEAGLLPGDRIISVDGVPIEDGFQYMQTLMRKFPGDALQLEVERSGERLVVALTVEPRERR